MKEKAWYYPGFRGLLGVLILALLFVSAWGAKLYYKEQIDNLLLEGVSQNRVWMVRRALKEGADANLADLWEGERPATTNWLIQRLQKLLYGHVFYADGPPVLYVALQRREVDIVQALLEAGANPNAVMSTGAMVFTEAFSGTSGLDAKLLRLLLEHGVNPNTRIDDAPLLFTLMQLPYTTYPQEERRELVRLLIAYGANLEARNRFGETPLIRAVSSNNIAIAKILLQYGARPNVHEPDGETPLDIAKQSGNAQMIQLLRYYLRKVAKKWHGASRVVWVNHPSPS